MKLLTLRMPTQSVFDETVKKIVEQPSYKHLSQDWMDMTDRIKEKISEWISKLFNKLGNGFYLPPTVSERLSIAFMIICLLLILTIAIVIVIRMNKTFSRNRRVKEILGEKIEENTTPNSLRYKAKTYEEQGDLRVAIRFDFIALLLLMHESNILYLDETKTNEEILRYLKINQYDRLSQFAWLVKYFNYFWYGHKVCEKDTYEKWKNGLEQVWNEVAQHEKKKK